MAAQYGYIRVSGADQNEARQVIAMREAGLDGNHIYMDKQSGKDFERPAYQRLVRRLRPGDLLCVQSIDRLGRNYEEVRDLDRATQTLLDMHERLSHSSDDGPSSKT